MRGLALGFFLAGVALASSAATPGLKVLKVGAHSLSLAWDPAWQVAQPEGGPPNSAQFQLADPHDMVVQISAQERPSADADVDEFMRHVIDDAVQEFQKTSVEKKLEPRAFSKNGTHGYTVCATDRAPKPDEFKYVCQGVATNGEIAVIFTVLYNEPGKKSAQKATAALEAMQVTNPA
jgi:hypothetical protein